MWQFWIDRGGTFTDIIAHSPDGKFLTHKVLSENPEQYNDAAVHGIRTLLAKAQNRSDPKEAVLGERISAIKMGTTVATNALLERKGDATLLLITEGFGDLLRIGYQNRPKLFDLHIQLPELLYQRVSEVPERLSFEGTVQHPIDRQATKDALQQAYDAGIRGVAIAFLHGYLNPRHEKIAAQIAAEIGFQQISVSHEVSSLIKLVSRGDTTVVDAYLSPILRRYVAQIQAEVAPDEQAGENRDSVRLMFMQSHGGLTDASMFQGKDAILSGPAGGVVGMAKIAQDAGFNQAIGFDMGGTSTDVCHFAGEYERSLETEVAGVRMRAPMMNIHTVAAGGGSILHFSQGRLQVGPHSAGADPGPACYRRGGPLSVTDANLLLGKIQPQHFPCIFGENADQPLDVEIVREKFQQLAQQIATETAQPALSPEKLAAGFLTIAVENMANAIKKISVQRGYDVSEYVLHCFGGAGGQHACAVADALGMESILVHPYAGVLSALGMGLADIRAMREQQAALPLAELDRTFDAWHDLDEQAKQEVIAQGIPADRVHLVRTAHLRTQGSHQSLAIPFGSSEEMMARFAKAHQQRYGYVPDCADLLLEIMASEAIGETAEAIPQFASTVASGDGQRVSICTQANWQDIMLYHRDQLGDKTIQGPAIITEDTGTNVIEPGWQASLDSKGNLLMKRSMPRPGYEEVATNADPVMLEVFNNLFMSIAEQMGATLSNTAYSVNIKERLDFSCAIFNPAGDLVANAPHMPVHLGSMGESVRCILRDNREDLRTGDVYMLNNPFNGGTHLPDITVVTPVFDAAGKEIIFVVASRGHHADVGGKSPGSAPPDSRHLEEEGVVIDNFLLLRDGRFREKQTREILASGRYPCRNIDENIADLGAQIAANATGVAELGKMVEHFGLKVVQAYMVHVQDNAEESVRRVLDVLKDAEYTHRLDNGAQICVKITVDSASRSAIIDFRGTSAQSPLNYNAPKAVCRAATLYVFRTLVPYNIPLNEGCLKPLKLIIPEGSMINPRFPAAVIAGNTEVSQAITETLYGALGVLAGSQGTMNNFVYGNARYQNYETLCGGTGAGKNFDGTSAVHSHMTNTRMTDPEVLEGRYPVQIEKFSIRPGSGGHGRHRGGDGVIRRLKFLDDMTVTVLSSNRVTRPFGVDGGGCGKSGFNRIDRADGTIVSLQGNDTAQVRAGDVFHMETPGGGGYGQDNDRG